MLDLVTGQDKRIRLHHYDGMLAVPLPQRADLLWLRSIHQVFSRLSEGNPPGFSKCWFWGCRSGKCTRRCCCAREDRQALLQEAKPRLTVSHTTDCWVSLWLLSGLSIVTISLSLIERKFHLIPSFILLFS